jgi:ArsR family transcriptional regulator, arsenate/arsenite/antimonite-responsive transcriptional repressor
MGSAAMVAAVPLTTADAAACLEALGNPTRLSIYRLLVCAGPDGLPVGGIQARLQMAASTLSHHVKMLVTVGLVDQERDGTTLICRSNYDLMHGLVGFLVAECCAGVPPRQPLPETL